MILIRHSNLVDYELSIERYKNTQTPLLAITHDDQKIMCYFNQKLSHSGWSNYIIITLKLYLDKLGLKPNTLNGVLYLYRDQIVTYHEHTNNKLTRGTLVIKLLKDYGISLDEVIDLIIKSTREYLERRKGC